MNKNILFCSLFVLMSIMSYNSFASVVTYYLDGNYMYDDLDGFITYESVGIPNPEPDAIDAGWVDFKVYEFYLETENYVLVHNINKANDNISFMVSGISDGSLRYHGDRVYFPTVNFLHFHWIYEVADNGSLIFAPNAFDMYYEADLGEFTVDGTVHAMSTVSAVDEPGAFTFVLYGLLSVCLIAVIKRTNVIKC